MHGLRWGDPARAHRQQPLIDADLYAELSAGCDPYAELSR